MQLCLRQQLGLGTVFTSYVRLLADVATTVAQCMQEQQAATLSRSTDFARHTLSAAPMDVGMVTTTNWVDDSSLNQACASFIVSCTPRYI